MKYIKINFNGKLGIGVKNHDNGKKVEGIADRSFTYLLHAAQFICHLSIHCQCRLVKQFKLTNWQTSK